VTISRINSGLPRMGNLLILLAFAIATCLSTNLSAQELSATQGGLSGTVTDNSGGAVPGAKVTLTGGSDKRATTTDSGGRYTVTGLTPGLYDVSVEMTAFKSTQVKNVEVFINKISTLNLSLQVGQVTETVEVNANSLEVDTNSTAISTNLSNTFYDQVPVQRNVGSLFYTAPGVINSGDAGNANPSVGGASGLENSYVADGVDIGDAGYGGLGVFSPNYGSVGTGLNLTFVQEVQVKEGAFEPKYGKANGGVLQIVTKSGGTAYHGALSAYFAPGQFNATDYYADDFFDRQNVRGHISGRPEYDAAVELGGPVPGNVLKSRLFFYGAFNPALNQIQWLAAPGSGLLAHGQFVNSTTAKSWAGKLTFKLNEATSIDASGFGDPSTTNKGIQLASVDSFPLYPNLNQNNEGAFSLWKYGTRTEVVHLTSSITPTWELNIAASAKQAHFDETGYANDYQILDYSNAVSTASGFIAQGLGPVANPTSNSAGFSIDTQKTVNLHGQHTFSIGWSFQRSIYDKFNGYSGPEFNFPTVNDIGAPVTNPGLAGASASALFNLNSAAGLGCAVTLCPLYNGTQVYLSQVRGIYSTPHDFSSSGYHAIYGNDDWAINRYVTINAGLRWEEEQLNGPNQQYTFVDNWSPRVGINVDPFGDRKSKVFFNWGRYTQALPSDAAIRELNQESDIYSATFSPESDGHGNVIVGPNGTVVPVLDAAHLISGDPAAGGAGSAIFTQGSIPELVAPKTKLNFEEEYVIGLERQVKGFVVSARYTDRRLLRIIEDMSGAPPEGYFAGIPQLFRIGNPNAKSDYFVNPIEEKYLYIPDPNMTGYHGQPANCPIDSGQQVSSSGALIPDAVCFLNPPNATLTAGAGTYLGGTDGIPDGAPNARRHYQAAEFEANKNFSNHFLLRANYRYANLFGNYEGLARNDNDQFDPGISSLYDFTLGVLGELGDQYVPGWLNTDRRHSGNLYGSYVWSSGFVKKLTTGIGLRGSSGIPITPLGAHPAYQNAGEIPLLPRGSLGREPASYQLDSHLDYPVSLGEKYKLKLAFDMFNVTDSRFLTAKDQDTALSFTALVGPVNNVDFLKPESFQRAFNARGSIRFEF
jgi:Carboxypeptidase regulatory-like domain